MGSYDLAGFVSWVDKAINNVQSAIKESDEMQTAFNSEYINNMKIKYDGIVEKACEALVKKYSGGKIDRRSKLYDELSAKIAEKKKELLKKQDGLGSELNKAEDELEKIKNVKNKSIDKIKKANPELNDREEKQKLIVSRHEGAVLMLRNNIKMLSSGLGFIMNYFTVSKLRSNYMAGIEILKKEKEKLSDIRKEYLEMKHGVEEKEKGLQLEFQEAMQKVSFLRQSLKTIKLDFELNLIIEGVKSFFDLADEQIVLSLNPEISEAGEIVNLRRLKLEYEEGLKLVAEEIGFLNGIKSGFLNIKKTADSLYDQYSKYSSYLSSLNVNISDACENYLKELARFASKIIDDKSLGKNPRQFLEIVKPFHSSVINESVVKSMFTSVGGAISEAAKKWK